MEIELNKLVEHFAHTSFLVQGVYYNMIEPGRAGWQKSAPYPGFIFPLDGQAQFHFNGTAYLAGMGKMIHGGANMSLAKRVVGNKNWEYISVLYAIQGLVRLYFAVLYLLLGLEVGSSPRLTELLRRLWNSFNQPGAFPAFRTETLFRCVLEEVFVCAGHQMTNSAQALFEQVASYIHEHYMEALTVSGLAAQNGVNENRLFYVFSKFAGTGPSDYLMAYRLNRAKELLITGDAPIGEVARNVGYLDTLYFTRIFRKRLGVTPSALRAKSRNNPYNFQDASIPI